MCKKKLVCFLMVLAIALMGVNINFCTIANNLTANPDKSVFYLTKSDESTGIKINSYNKEVKTATPDTIETKIPSDNVNVWVDVDLLSNGKVEKKLKNVYEAGGRIVIKGGALKRSDIRKYFGLDTKAIIPIIEEPIRMEGTVENEGKAIGTKSVGIMIYKQDGINNVTNIFGNKDDSDEDINEVFYYVTQYDYIGLANGEQKKADKIISMNGVIASAESYSWNNVDIDTRTDYCDRLYFDISLTLSKNASNPNSNGEYLYASTFRMDIDVRSSGDPQITFCISKNTIKNTGGSGAKIYDYGPHNRSGSTNNFSFSLPWGLSFNYDPECKAATTKIAGGINSKYVTIDYVVKSLFNLQGYDYDGIWCENSYEAYQDGSYFQSTGYYKTYTYIDFYNMGTGDHQIINPENYYMGTTFSVSGT